MTEMRAPADGGELFTPQINEVPDRDVKVPLLSAGMVAISYLAGTIDSSDQLRFKKMVYRATRGKAFT